MAGFWLDFALCHAYGGGGGDRIGAYLIDTKTLNLILLVAATR